jgi:hypothetical protein
MTTLAFQDLACPRCGHSGSFHIDVVATAFVDACGACVESDYYWDGDSSCACLRCSHEALVSDFCAKSAMSPLGRRRLA